MAVSSQPAVGMAPTRKIKIQIFILVMDVVLEWMEEICGCRRLKEEGFVITYWPSSSRRY